VGGALLLAACAADPGADRAENWRQPDGSAVDPVRFEAARENCDRQRRASVAVAPRTGPTSAPAPFRPGGIGLGNAAMPSDPSTGASAGSSAGPYGSGASDPSRYESLRVCLVGAGFRPAD
jgi:hypothetical protein